MTSDPAEVTNDPADRRILRAKYLDWCSAKVADRFLELTPDQIYELAHWHSEDQVGQALPPASEMSAESLSLATAGSPMPPAAYAFPVDLSAEAGAVYLALVERVAEVLAATLKLPSLEEWISAYHAAPEPFDAELLGFWRGERRGVASHTAEPMP